MYDKELAVEILEQIYHSTEKIQKRFEPINSPDDFTHSNEGQEKLDAICMQLITIGESLKNLDKVTGNSLLPSYPEVEWKKAMALRDIISHHYFDINVEAIFEVCETHIGKLAKTIQKILNDLSRK
ncbi:MAG: DUF86 domain-containing protein [Deltaproteobacteria bacterium]|nr:DUF86 domain-containing protein [Deltaproteobacteria bacterium]